MADVKINEYDLLFATTIGDADSVRVVMSDNTSKNILYSNFMADYSTSASIAATYLTITDASNTYLTITNAGTTYLTIANANSTYLTISNAASTYLTISDASDTYLTAATAASTYLTISAAAITYAPISNVSFDDNLTADTVVNTNYIGTIDNGGDPKKVLYSSIKADMGAPIITTLYSEFIPVILSGVYDVGTGSATQFKLKGRKNGSGDTSVSSWDMQIHAWVTNYYLVDNVNGDKLIGRMLSESTISVSPVGLIISTFTVDPNFTNDATYITIGGNGATFNTDFKVRTETKFNVRLDVNTNWTDWNNDMRTLSTYEEFNGTSKDASQNTLALNTEFKLV